MLGFFNLLTRFFLTAILIFALQPVASAEWVPPWGEDIDQYTVTLSSGDIHEGAVSDSVVFYGRLETDGILYSGVADIAMRIYASPASLHSACYCSDEDCYNSSIPTNVEGCLWQSSTFTVTAKEGLFSIDISSIPLSVLAVPGKNNKKYYEIISYVGGSASTVNSGSLDNGYAILDSVMYAYAAKALEENAKVVLSTLTVVQGGNIYLNRSSDGTNDNGSIIFRITKSTSDSNGSYDPAGGVIVTKQSNAEADGQPFEIVSTGYVFTNSEQDTSFYTGDPDHEKADNTLSMYIDQQGKVGIGTKSPSRTLEISTKNRGNVLPADISAQSIVSSNQDGQVVFGSSGPDSYLQVSTITNLSAGIDANSGGIYLKDGRIGIKSPNSAAGHQFVLASDGTNRILRINDVGDVLPDADVSVNGRIYAENGFIAGNIVINPDSMEFSTVDKDYLLMQPLGSDKNVIVGNPSNTEAKLQVFGSGAVRGIKTDSLDVISEISTATFTGSVIFSSSETFNISTETGKAILSTTTVNGNLYVNGESAITDIAYLTVKNNVFNRETSFKDNVLLKDDVFFEHGLIVSGASFLEQREETDPASLQIGSTSTAKSYQDSFLAINSADSVGSLGIYGNDGENYTNSLNIVSDSSNNSIKIESVNGASIINYDDMQEIHNGNFITDFVRVYTDVENESDDSHHPLVVFGNIDDSINVEQNDAVAIVNGDLSVSSITFINDPSGKVMDSSYIGDFSKLAEISTTGVVSIRTTSGKIILQNSKDVVSISTFGNVSIGNVPSPSHTVTLAHNIGYLMVGNVDNVDSGMRVKANIVDALGNIYVSSSVYTGSTIRIDNTGRFLNTVWKSTTPVAVAYGGLGRLSYEEHVVLKGNGESAVINNEKLHLNSSAEIEKVLPIANGGTGANAFSAADPVRFDSVNNKFITGAINLASEISGIMALDNGGTGGNLSGVNGVLRNYNNIVISTAVQLGSSSDIGNSILGVSNGGFGWNFANFGQPGFIYAVSGSSVGLQAVSSNNPIIGDVNGTPFAMSDESWILENISDDRNTAGVIDLTIGQSVATTSTPTFSGLTLSGISGYLELSADGSVHSKVMDLNNILSDPLEVKNGGTGTDFASTGAGPVRLVEGTEPKLATGTINLALDASGTLGVSNGGIGESSYNTGEFVVATGTGSFRRMGLADGQLFIGSTGNKPAAAAITYNANQISAIPGTGTITLGLPQDIDDEAAPTFAGIVITGLNGFVKADGSGSLGVQNVISLAADTDNILPLAKGGTGNDISAVGTGLMRNYGDYLSTTTVNLSDVSDVGNSVLKIANGGLGNVIETGGSTGLIHVWGSSATVARLNLDAGSTDYETGTILETDHGGTGVNSISAGAGVVKTDGSHFTKSLLQLDDDSEVIGVLPISNGGTGISSYTANSVLYTDPSESNVIREMALEQGQFVIGGNDSVISGDFVSGNDSIVVDTETAGRIRIGFVQNMNKTASPVFAGITLTGEGQRDGVLHTNATGYITTHILNINDYMTVGTLDLKRGGIGVSSFTNAGPIINLAGSIDTGKIDLESTDVANVLPVANGGTGLSSAIAANKVIVSMGSNLDGIALGKGQLLIGNTTGIPSAATLTGTANKIVIASDDGEITVSLPQDLDDEATPEFAGLEITGRNGYMKAESGTVVFSTYIVPGDIDGTLRVKNGGTGVSSLENNGIAFLDSGTTDGKVLNLANSSQVSGQLSVANGGLGQDFSASDPGVLVFDAGSFSVQPASITAHTVGNLLIANGGTGITSENFASSKVIAYSAEDTPALMSLASGQFVGSNETGNISAMSLASGVSSNGIPFITVSTDSEKLTVIPQQALTNNSSPTFSTLKLTDSEYKKTGSADIYSTDGTNIEVYAAKYSDMQGVLPVAKGGLGAFSPSNGNLLYAAASDTVGTLDMSGTDSSDIVLVMGQGAGQPPVAVSLTGDAAKGLVIDTTTMSGTATISIENDLTTTSTPTFAGMVITGLKNSNVLKADAEGKIVSADADAPLAVSLGGTGVSSHTVKSLVYADTEGKWSRHAAFAEGKTFIGNGSSQPVAVGFAGVNGVVVSTSGENVSVSFAQDLGTTSTSAQFGTVTLYSNLNLSSLNVTGTLTLTDSESPMNGTDLSADSLSTTNFFKIPTENYCRRDMTAGSVGEIRFCKQRTRYYCSDGTLIYDEDRSKYTCKKLFGTNSDDRYSGSEAFNQLIFSDGTTWRCASNGERLGLTSTECYEDY